MITQIKQVQRRCVRKLLIEAGITNMACSMEDKYNQVSQKMNENFYKGFSLPEITLWKANFEALVFLSLWDVKICSTKATRSG